MILMHLDTYAGTLCRNVRIDVILPEVQRGKPMPMLVLLHGMTDDQTMWQRRTSIERYADDYGVAVIMPSTELNWYANTQIGERWFDYVSDELLRIVRSLLPCLSDKREDTFVAGLSMGGYGALRCALERPENFSKAASLSGGVDVKAVTKLPVPLADAHFWEDVFGPSDGIPGTDHDLFHAAETCTLRPDVFMWCGLQDFLYYQNVRMRDHLRRLGYNLNYHETPGDHQWCCWDREIQNVLAWIFDGKGEESTCR